MIRARKLAPQAVRAVARPFGLPVSASVSARLSACAIGAVILATPQIAAADTVVTVSNPAEFESAFSQIVTSGSGASTLTYDGASANLVINSGIGAPGSNTSLEINLAPSSLVIGSGANASGSLVLGTGTDLVLGVGGSGSRRMEIGRDGATGSVTLDGGNINMLLPAGGAGRLYVGGGASNVGGGSGTLNINSGGINFGSGDDTAGYGGFRIGSGLGVTGAVNMTGGFINYDAVGGNLEVGHEGGSGSLTMGGTSSLSMEGALSMFRVGEGGGAHGLVTVNDSASIRVVGDFNGDYFSIGRESNVPGGGTGELVQNGAGSSIYVAGVYASIALGGSTGSYTLNDGRFEVGAVNGVATDLGVAASIGPQYLGKSDGTFTINGGAALLSGNLLITENQQTSTGRVILNGGTLTVGGQIAFGQGTGSFTQTGGVLELGGANAISPSSGPHASSVGFGGGVVRATSDLGIAHDATLSGAGATFDSNGYVINYSGALGGAAGFTKIGDGSIVVSGANSFVGNVAVLGGTLETASATALGAAGGRVTLDGGALKLSTLVDLSGGVTAGAANGVVDMASHNVTLGGVSDGAGGVTFNNGNLTLAGTLAWQGNTVLGNNVTLTTTAANQFSPNSTLSLAATAAVNNGDFTQQLGGLSGGGVISSTGTIAVGANNASTQFDGVISGAATLRKVGAGALVLTQAQAYTGGTSVESGSLALTGAGKFADGSDVLVSGGVLDLGGSTQKAGLVSLSGGAINNGSLDSSTGFWLQGGQLNASISGSGPLLKNGAASMTLAGANPDFSGNIIVEQGELRGAVAAFGAGNAIRNDGLVTFVESGNAVWGGAITGAGSLGLTGGGAFEIVGNGNTFSGQTLLQSGSLLVNGALANSTVVVSAGATLGGSGVIGGLSAQGVVAPGNSIGTLTVAGNVAFAAGSIYQAEVNSAGASDLIAATGTATLSGATVQVLADAGQYARRTNYTILTAGGGVTGRFGAVSSNFAYLTPTLTYGATQVGLQLDRNDVAFGAVALTRNELFTANAVESLGLGNPVYDAILFGTLAQARTGFNMLSGEIHAAVTTNALSEANITREAILDRLRSAHGARTPLGQMVAPADTTGLGATFWGQGFGSWGESKRSAGLASVDRRSGGFLLGADTRFNNVTVGVAGGYVSSNFDMQERLSRASSSTVFGSLYAGANFGPMQLSGGVLYAGSQNSTNRGIAFSGFSDYASAKYDTGVFQAFAEASWRVALGNQFGVSPFVNMAAVRINTDGFAERGGPAALVGYDRTDDIGVATAGIRFDGRLTGAGSAGVVSVNGTLGWRGAFGDVRPAALNAFRSGFGAAPFAIESVPVDRSAIVVGAGLDWAVTSAMNLGVSYSGQYGSQNSDQQFRGKAEVRF